MESRDFNKSYDVEGGLLSSCYELFLSSVSSSSAISILGEDSSDFVYTIGLRFLVLTSLALGQRPLVLKSQWSHLGLTGRHITCSKKY